MTDDFVHLHVHSEYSLLDGLGRIKNLVKEAKRLGQPALALTDHGVMHGAIEFFRACKEQGIRPLIGVEAYQTVHGRPMGGRDAQLDRENYHLLLLARNMPGYRNLLKIASHAQLDGYYYKPRVDHDFLAAHAEGIIASTGCLGAEVPQLLAQGREREAYERLGWYVDIFGKENFFIELQEHSIPDLVQVNKTLAPWAEKFGLHLVATNDVHYVREEDGSPHDVLLCVQTGVPISQQNRMRMSDGSYFLKSRAQMEATFRPFLDLPASAFEHSVRLAEMCEVDLEDPTYHLPDLPIPAGHTYETYLRELTEEGLRRLYADRFDTPEVQERKERELRIIHEMGFDVYYLIVADLCNFARSRNIWWNVRGSGAGSLVAYCTGITGIDPLKNNLIFERFLNPGRVTMPDFDLDYPDDQREEMIRYTVEKFGESQVAQIATFNRMKARAAVRDVGRAQGVELSQVDRIAKLIPAIPGKPCTIKDCLTEGHEFYNQDLVKLYGGEPWVRELLDSAMKLEGVARNAGIHAAAVIVADTDLVNYTPLMRGSKSTVTSTIAQYEFPILESIGLLKVDFLGLSTLSVMREATRLIRERHGIEYTLNTIPYEGEPALEAFKLLASGEVSGVFQVESQGMRRVLTEMKPFAFEHIVAMISLYRPGPIEYIPAFIRRMHEQEPVDYKHPLLETILSETYGICVSGDAMIADAHTGRRYRLEEIGKLDEFFVQGVDDEWRPAVGRVTHWIDSGEKPVYRITLRNGASTKVTADHRLLTEHGWQPLHDLKLGDFVAAPPHLFGPRTTAQSMDRRHLRVLAYLLGDGSLASMACVDFVSKDPALLAEYQRCLAAFEGVRPDFTEQVRGVVRIGASKQHNVAHYHTPNTLLAWLRELGLKAPAGQRPGGSRSHEKYVPDFVFMLGEGEIAFFLASLWDCDGYVGAKLCHYKTVSAQLAEQVHTLLLRLGIQSTIYQNQYTIGAAQETQRTGYQVTVYDTAHFAALLQPHMASAKRDVACAQHSYPTLARQPFLEEVDAVRTLSYRGLMATYGIDRQHFYPKGRARERISAHVAAQLVDVLPLPETQKRLNVAWEEVVAIEYVGVEHVYDLTVEGLHSFVADNIVVHNCVYQEQIIQILSHLAGYTPGEADLLRRAISKKKASEIEKHKKIFVAGCEKNGIDHATSEAIYGDIEFFARYGFNKSHAADYAVITVQTAYLKAHYPVEYMAAQLLVERDKTEKVVNFVSECRRMGIDVLAPDVNYSGLDFDIQLRPPDTQAMAKRDPSLGYNFPVPEGSAIRFGMAAIKNVGEGPVQVIIDTRNEGGPFHSLEEFCDRVDLRQVNKRALECLIKAGALDRFGRRSQLLAVLDQLVAQSAGVHDARDSGQLSMFDLLGSNGEQVHVTPIRLPDLEEVKGKEKLQWEKELLGVYSISHPLLQIGVDLQQAVTCSCAELDERHDGKGVALAGIITNVRTLNTKKGDLMAFVQLEDLQGGCEVVFFPKTYAEQREKLQPDAVVIIKGKAQTREGRTSLLAETVQTHFDKIVGIDDPQQHQTPLFTSAPTVNGMVMGNGNGWEDDSAGDDGEAGFGEQSPFTAEVPAFLRDVAAPPPLVIAETPASFAVSPVALADEAEGTKDEDDPVGDDPVDDDPVGKAAPSELALAAQPAMVTAPTTGVNGSPIPAPPPTAQPVKAAPAVSATPAPAPATAASHQPTDEPAMPTRNGHATRRLLIIFRRSGNLERDKFRLREIYDLVRNAKGRDSFAIRIIDGAKSAELAFPNDACSINEHLETQLKRHFKVEINIEPA